MKNEPAGAEVAAELTPFRTANQRHNAPSTSGVPDLALSPPPGVDFAGQETREGAMRHTSIHRALTAAAILAAALGASSAAARDTKTEEPVFEFSSPFVGAQTHYIWKINRIDGSLYLCQTTTANVKCNQVAGPNGEVGPFSLSDAVAESGAAGFHVWRLNRWTGTQELCVSGAGQKGCSK
jgi:hypothetical protein